MELMLNSANLSAVERAIDLYPVDAVTTCASVMEKEGKVDFFDHLHRLKELIGARPLHVQVVSTEYAAIMREADKVRERLGMDTYIRIPATREGMKAIKDLAHEGVNVTAACIMTPIQGMLAEMAGADYLLIEYQRMVEAGLDAPALVRDLRNMLDHDDESYARLLCVGFQSTDQLCEAYRAGSDACSIDPELLSSSLDLPVVEKVTDHCKASWRNVHGDKTLLDL